MPIPFERIVFREIRPVRRDEKHQIFYSFAFSFDLRENRQVVERIIVIEHPVGGSNEQNEGMFGWVYAIFKEESIGWSESN